MRNQCKGCSRAGDCHYLLQCPYKYKEKGKKTVLLSVPAEALVSEPEAGHVASVALPSVSEDLLPSF